MRKRWKPDVGASHSEAYLRFLNLMEAIRGRPDLPNLQRDEQELLEWIAKQWFAGNDITVLEVLNDNATGMSPSTTHKRLKTLKQADLVALETDPNDNRTKHVVPTPTAYRYFESLGRCLIGNSHNLGSDAA